MTEARLGMGISAFVDVSWWPGRHTRSTDKPEERPCVSDAFTTGIQKRGRGHTDTKQSVVTARESSRHRVKIAGLLKPVVMAKGKDLFFFFFKHW